MAKPTTQKGWMKQWLEQPFIGVLGPIQSDHEFVSWRGFYLLRREADGSVWRNDGWSHGDTRVKQNRREAIYESNYGAHSMYRLAPFVMDEQTKQGRCGDSSHYWVSQQNCRWTRLRRR